MFSSPSLGNLKRPTLSCLNRNETPQPGYLPASSRLDSMTRVLHGPSTMSPGIPRYPPSSRAKVKDCTLCGRPRSRRYLESPHLEPLVCSRCVKRTGRMASPSRNVVVEVRNHHHASWGPDAHANEFPHAARQPQSEPAELSADVRCIQCVPIRSPGQLSSMREESPPPVRRGNKPVLRR